jgi:hypothetical protein
MKPFYIFKLTCWAFGFGFKIPYGEYAHLQESYFLIVIGPFTVGFKNI